MGDVTSPEPAMDDLIQRLASTRTIDITTVGRKSRDAARIEIWWFRVGDAFYITGTPGRRDWFANLAADPTITVHTPDGDFAGRASVVSNPDTRRAVLSDPQLQWYRSRSELERLVSDAPMVQVVLDTL